MGAFQAIRDAEAAGRDDFFRRSKGQRGYTSLDSIEDSYRRGEYSGGEDRPAYNNRGRKKIQGYKASQRFKGESDRQNERDSFFRTASFNRIQNTQTQDEGAKKQMLKSFDRHHRIVRDKSGKVEEINSEGGAVRYGPLENRRNK